MEPKMVTTHNNYLDRLQVMLWNVKVGDITFWMFYLTQPILYFTKYIWFNCDRGKKWAKIMKKKMLEMLKNHPCHGPMAIVTWQHKQQCLSPLATMNDDVDIVKWLYLKCTP